MMGTRVRYIAGWITGAAIAIAVLSACDAREQQCRKEGGTVKHEGDWKVCYDSNGKEKERWINVNR